MLVGVVDEPEGRADCGRGELRRQRVARAVGLVLVERAAAAVVREVEAHPVRLGPGRGAIDVGRGHADCRLRRVVRGVRRRVPGVVAEEQVVDLDLEVVALVAEEDAARDPVEHPVPQQLVVALELVAGDGHDHLLAPVVGMRVDPEERGVAGPGHQRLPVGAIDRRRRVAERLGRHGVVVRDLDRSLEVGEGGLAGGGERADDAVLRGADRAVEPVGGAGSGVVAQPADAEGALELRERRPLGVGQGRQVARGPVRVVDAVAEVTGGEDHGLIARVVRRVVGQARVGQRRRLRLARVGHERVERHAFALQLSLPGAEAGLAAVRGDQEHLEVDRLPRRDLHGRGAQRERHRDGERRGREGRHAQGSQHFHP